MGVGGQGGGDGAEEAAEEAPASACADDDQLGGGAERDEHAGGITGLRAEARLTGVVAQEFGSLGECTLRLPLRLLAFGLTGHGSHVRVDHRRQCIGGDDGQCRVAPLGFDCAGAHGQGCEVGPVEADEDAEVSVEAGFGRTCFGRAGLVRHLEPLDRGLANPDADDGPDWRFRQRRHQFSKAVLHSVEKRLG